jgi:hypothetical protein
MTKNIFCIGLHKTGTSTLRTIACQYGLKGTHRTNWNNDDDVINSHDFFSDGGSHFDNQNEFNFIELYHKYPDSKFILNTRDTKKWIISKCKHGGWRENTIVQENDYAKIKHETWNYKSLLNIRKFMIHKVNYERKVLDFFESNKKNRLLVIDITDNISVKQKLKKLCSFIGGYKKEVDLIHDNKRGKDIKLSDEVLSYIDSVMIDIKDKDDYNNNKMKKYM